MRPTVLAVPVTIFSILLALPSVVSAAAAGSCPDNSISPLGTDILYSSTSPTGQFQYDNAGGGIVPWTVGQPCSEGCYDLLNGWLEARGYNYLYGVSSAHVSTSDEYALVGPAGPPVSFEVVLRLHATIVTEGSATAGLGVPDLPTGMITLTASGTQELALPVTATPGQTFLVGAFATASGGHYDGEGLAQAEIRFRGVPGSYLITSCQGYNLPTPARPVSWGGVKAIYR